MSIPKKIQNYLEKAEAKFDIIEHRTVYTAYDAAQTMKRKIDEIVKNLVVKADKEYYLAVLPANKNLDLNKLKALINKNSEKAIKKVEIIKENALSKLFKVKPGLMPAFGNPYKIKVVMDKNLQKVKKAVFASGSDSESIEMVTKVFEKLEEPIVGLFSVAKKLPKQKITKPKKKAVKKTAKKKKKK